MVRRHGCAFALALAALAVAPSATADPEKAEALFRQGHAALEAGAYARACELLEQSLAEEPAAGTLTNVAYCHQMLGKNWHAYREYERAIAQAGSPDRRAFAERSMKQVEKKLPHVKLDLGGAVVARIELDDGTVIADPATPFPVEPGHRTLSLLAPPRPPRTIELDAPDGPGLIALILTPTPDAVTAPAPAPAPLPPSKPSPPTAPFRTKTLGLVSGGVGLAGIAVGSYFGLRSFSIRDSACATSACTQDGLDRVHGSATTTATLSSVAFGVGIAALIGGAILFFVRPGEH